MLKTIKGIMKSGKGEMLTQGDEAPDYELTTHTGESFRLSAHRGHKVLMWFYPKAATPG